MSKRFAFYTSGGSARVCQYLEQQNARSTAFVVYDDGDHDSLKALCEKNSVKFYSINYSQLGLKGAAKGTYLSDKLLELLIQDKVDYLFCFGVKILRGELLNKYSNRIINFHPSLLPAFPGLRAIDQALEAKAFLLGNTAHFIDKGVDTGPVIMQSIVAAASYMNYGDVLNMQGQMLVQIMEWIDQDRLNVIDNQVHIKNAIYSAGPYIPALES